MSQRATWRGAGCAAAADSRGVFLCRAAAESGRDSGFPSLVANSGSGGEGWEVAATPEIVT